MSSKGLLFIGIFAFCAIGAVFVPYLGIYGYVADYCLNPADQWWGRPFSRMGIRFSFILAISTMIGIVLQRKTLKFGEKILYKQEVFLLIFLAIVWLTFFIGATTVGRYGSVDHPTVKFTKIVIFSLMMTHVITDLKKLNGLLWVLATVSLLLGIKAWDVPYRSFVSGRLEGIGGADFSEANFFAAFMVAMLPFIAVLFLHSKWYGKIYCFVAGAFTANAVILCRSRGAFLGLAMGAAAAFFYAPQKHRKNIIILIIVGSMGVAYLSDNLFIERVISISTDQSQMDEASSSRIRLWKAGAKMFIDNPLGIGPGNWYQTIGRYIPEYAGKDSHNTYVKCLAELGALGISVFILLLLQTYFSLRKTYISIQCLQPKQSDEFSHYYFAVIVSIVVFLTCSLTITTIYTEVLWILLMLPVCLNRALDNYLIEKDLQGKGENKVF
ncbi:MAG: O-antigen ligase family protein [Deltaproteobacteria bacterium]|nr:O-antigen ligase family protein [Deltaproteobacteria bacterium]